MSNDKPQVNFGGADDAGFDDSHIQQHTERSRVKFNTRLRADLYEKLRAASFWLDDESITDLVEEAVARYLQHLEGQRGEPFEVLDPHKVDDSPSSS